MIRVRGIAKSISKDALEMFFENTRKSGGGDIENLEWERKKGEAFITFKGPSVVQRVLEKQKREPFYLEKAELSVEEYVPPPLDPLRLFLKNLSAGITEEYLILYLEPCCNALPTKIHFGRLPGTALVIFSEEPDIGLLLGKVKEKALQGQYIEVTRVPVTRCVQLRGLLPSTSRDTVVLYFENVKRSNGGPVKDLKKGRDKQSFIITFENAEDAERVCRKQHTIDRKEIQVCLYYECLGEDLDADDVSDLIHGVEDTVAEFKLPDPVRLNNWNPQILRFLMNNRKHRAMFEKNLSDVNGVAKWPSSLEGDVIIECSMKADDEHANSLLKDWTTRVIKMVHSFIAGFDVAEFTLIQMAWPRVLEVLKTITIDNPEDVAVFLDQEKHNIAVAGPRANVQELKNVIKQMIIMVEATIKLETKRVMETKTLRSFEIALLRMSHFIQEIEKMHPELKFEIDQKERMAIFDGQADIVQKVMTQMHEKLNSFVSRSMQMSKAARNLLFAKETRKYIKQKMFAQKLVGVWDVQYDELLMFGRGEKEVIKAIEIVTSCIVENRIPLDEAMAQLVQEQQWSQLVQGILKKHTGKCAVETDIKDIIVVAVDNIFQDVFNEVKAFVDYYTVQETFLELNPELVKFIKQYKSDDIMELEKQFEKSLVKLYVADVGKQKGVKIKGMKDGCKSAKVAIAELAKCVFTTEHVMANKVGLTELLQGSTGRSQLGFIEVRWKCLIVMKNANQPDTWQQEAVGRLPRTREKMSSLVLSITADSRSNAQSAIRDIESFVKSEIMEKEINSPREIISKLLDKQVTKMELMGQGKAMVSVNQRKGIILVSGAPKEVLDTYDRVMKYLRNIELDKLKQDQEKLKKQQEMSDLRFPVTWTRMANDENLKCVSLNPNDQEYIAVSQKFLASAGSAGQQAVMMGFAMHYGSPGLTVIKIERVQNKSLYQQYKAKKRQLEQQNNGRANEKELWHGTVGTSIQNINHNGFNRSYSGSGSHGNGTYFAVNASYSVGGYCRPDASGHHHIYLAHVMTGDSIVLGSGTRVLPPKDPRNPHITYDSTTDNLANPQMFVIFHDMQAYPSYHITFQ
ncbi:hypothetical protein ACJMK2_005322 [Sinanodonta woodiana]|uniref:Poly [ADP-ribose] polymerase n=1 Tax=Sinanodonta woodiana TaxID=1069815 RepID=A0ABD3VPP4_SINWO